MPLLKDPSGLLDKLLLEPNLLRPGVKPVGQVEVDWSHPLARHIKAFVIFQPSSGTFIDLVTNTKAVTSSGSPSYSADKYSYDGIDDASELAIDLSDVGEHVVVTRFYWDFTNPETLPFEYSPNYNINDGFLVNPSAGAPFSGKFSRGYKTGGTGSPQAYGFTRPSTGYHNYVFSSGYVYTDSNAWVDAEMQTLDFGTFTHTQSGTFPNETLYFGARNSSSLFADVDMDYFIVFDGNIGEAIVAAGIDSNPYQLLKPAGQIALPIPVAAGGATILPMISNYNHHNGGTI